MGHSWEAMSASDTGLQPEDQFDTEVAEPGPTSAPAAQAEHAPAKAPGLQSTATQPGVGASVGSAGPALPVGATLSPSADFPGAPVIRRTWLRRFLDGARRASPVARRVLVTVLSLSPRPRVPPHRPDFRRSMLPSPFECGLGPGFFKLSRPPLRSLSLRLGDSLTLLARALPMGFKALISLLSAISLQGLWIFPWRAWLSAPAEHASLGWTHIRTFVPTMSSRSCSYELTMRTVCALASAATRVRAGEVLARYRMADGS